MTEKPVGIVIPTWNPNEPRFIVEDAHDGLADDRAFKNGKCVYNQRLGVVYTVEYVVDALNELGDEIDKLKEENEQLRQQLQEKQEEEKLYANEILELNKTKKEMLNFKQLGGDY